MRGADGATDRDLWPRENRPPVGGTARARDHVPGNRHETGSQLEDRPSMESEGTSTANDHHHQRGPVDDAGRSDRNSDDVKK